MNTKPVPKDPTSLNDSGCCFVENILSEDCRKLLLTALCFSEIDINHNNPQVHGAYELYNTFFLNIINQILLDKVKKITKIDALYSTYAFYRKYLSGQDLKKHTDRPECEVSITICLGESDENEEWPIYLENKEQKVIYEGVTKPGDGVIYKGCQLPHWRNKCNKKWTRQFFSHYSSNVGLEFDKKNQSNNIQNVITSYLIKTILENN